MHIARIDTIQLTDYPNICFVELATSDGVTGLGETFFSAEAVATWIHESAATYLLGKDPRQIQLHHAALSGFIGFSGTGVEMRARSALDIALYDLVGKYLGAPLYQLLGGKVRDGIRTYNTCAGPSYVRGRPEHPNLPVSNWGNGVACDDAQLFMTDAGLLAEQLVAEGYAAMKIWPFDHLAECAVGDYIDAGMMRQGLEPFERIRTAVGEKIEIIAELHSKWSVPNAIRIIRALRDYNPLWVEDPVRNPTPRSLAEVRRSGGVPIGASETLGGKESFRDLFVERAVDVAIFDPSWVGGVSESRRIADMAESFGLNVAPHDCMGPVEFAVAVHLSVSSRNALLQEVVRSFYDGWYRDLAVELPLLADGIVYPTEQPGVGIQLRPGVREGRTSTHRSSAL